VIDGAVDAHKSRLVTYESVVFLHNLFGVPFFFLSPRRRSGERTEERGIL